MFDGTEIDDKGNTMIGRDNETQSLKSLYRSGQAELVAVYGRRRVGKTYLISETFKTKLTFHHAGLSPVEMETLGIGTPLRKQLKHFYNSLIFPFYWNSYIYFFLLSVLLLKVSINKELFTL